MTGSIPKLQVLVLQAKSEAEWKPGNEADQSLGMRLSKAWE